MTTYYIDPTALPGGDGLSPETAFDSWASVSFATDNNSYLMRRGTEENVTTMINVFPGGNNSYFGNYGTGPLPILRKFQTTIDTDWTEIDVNIWEFDTGLGDQSPNAAIVLGVGALGAWTRRRDTQGATGNPPESFVNPGEWDVVPSDGGPNDAKIHVYSTAGNPVTTFGPIYWEQNQRPAMRFRSLTGTVVEGLRFENSWAGAYAVGWDGVSDITIQSCEMHQCHDGMYISGNGNVNGGTLNGAVFRDNVITDCGRIGLYVVQVAPAFPVVNLTISGNRIDEVGKSQSVGGIYLQSVTGTLGNENRIYDNLVENITHGYYWPNDGDGIFFDSGGIYYHVYRNTVRTEITPGATAYKVNSGATGTQLFYSNISEDISEGFRHGDTLNGDSADIELYNNAFLRCSDYGLRFNYTVVSSLTAIDNTLTSYGAVGSIGMFVWPPAAAMLAESSNVVYNFETDAENFTLDGSDITTDPLLNTNGYTQTTSPGYRSGEFIVGFHDVFSDQNRFAFNNPPDIGLQSNLVAPETAAIIAELEMDALDITQAQDLDTPTVTEVAILRPVGKFQAQTLGTPTLQEVGTTVVLDLSQAQTLGEPPLTQTHELAAQSLTQGQELGGPQVFEDIDLGAMDALTQAQTLGTPTVQQVAGLNPEDMAQAQTLGLVSISEKQDLAIENIVQAQTLGRPAVSDSTLPRLTPPSRRIKVAGMDKLVVGA